MLAGPTSTPPSNECREPVCGATGAKHRFTWPEGRCVASLDTDMTPDTLRLDRFCGHEVFSVERVEVYVQRPETDDDRLLLNLEIHGGKAVDVGVPETEQSPEATVEIWLPMPSLDVASLVGQSIHVPGAWLDEDGEAKWNRLYVFEHEDLSDIHATFVAVADGKCQMSLRGSARDPNHYDGSEEAASVSASFSFSVEELQNR